MLLFAGVNAWRQHLPEDTRLHGIVTQGGAAPNIIPEIASCRFYLRANENEILDMMEERFGKIAEGAALMTDTELEIIPTQGAKGYKPGMPNEILNQAYFDITSELGMDPVIPERSGRGSTDFGDVSQEIPGTHVYFGICRQETALHSAKFSTAAGEEYAIEQMLKTGEALGIIGYRFFTEEKFRNAMQEKFAARMA